MMDSVAARLQVLWDTVVAVYRSDATADPQLTILVVSTSVLLVAIVAIAVALIFMPPKRRVRRRILRRAVSDTTSAETASRPAESAELSTDESRPKRSEHEEPIPDARPARGRVASGTVAAVLLGPVGFALVFAAFFGVTYGVTSTDWYCTSSCHVELAPEGQPQASVLSVAAQVVRVDSSPAQHAPCVRCHGEGVVSEVAARTRMLVAHVAGRDDARSSAVVVSTACLRCHGDVLDGVVVGPSGTMRMSHIEPHEEGMACVRCHDRIAHEGASGPSMSECLDCHDDVRASAECSLCHLIRPPDIAAGPDGRTEQSRVTYAPVGLDSGNCYGCHDPVRCDACHGTRLPHTGAFIGGGHAVEAAFERKEMCFNCHERTECQECHVSVDRWGHGPSWKQRHGVTDRPFGCTCHDRKRPERASYCELCH